MEMFSVTSLPSSKKE
ncbi:hypothetical protein LINGRAPRIM_LOCUS667 [Linum grandiflorum]